MLRFQIPLAAFLIAAIVPQQGVVSLVPIPTQELQKSSASSQSSQESGLPEATPSPTSSPRQEERIQAEVAEIMAIRERLGGGVAEALGDLSLEMPGSKPQQGEPTKKPPLNYESEFAEFLAERSRTAKTQAHATSPIQQPAPERLLRQDPGSPGRLLPTDSLEPMDSLERRESIRHAARMLEEAAAALEEAGVYDRADQIRQTASELWRSAR